MLKTKSIYSLAKALAIAGLLLGTSAAQAQYPDKPIKLIAPFPAGGTTDYVARVVAKIGSEALKAPVVVDNRPGAGGLVGLESLARAKPDGYTIGIASGALGIYANVNKKMPFDAKNDFDFYGMVGRAPHVVLVRVAHSAKTFKEFLEYGKKNPGQTYASVGVGTNTHFTGELLVLETGLQLTHVPYKGGAQQMTDIVAGHVPIAIAGLTTALPFIKSGQVRPLALTGAKRSKAFPEIPTLTELGYPIDTGEWQALVGPRGTPEQVAAMWSAVAAKVVADPALTDNSPAFEPMSMTRDELKAFVAREVELWKAVAKRANISPE